MTLQNRKCFRIAEQFSLGLILSSIVKAGKPHWQQIQYAPDSPMPPKRTGHTMVNYADKLYVYVVSI
jgi:hypothetical protein